MTALTFTSWWFWAGFASVLLVLQAWQRHAPIRLQTPTVRKGLLLTFSLGFYAWAAQHLVWILVGSIVVNHGLALGIAKTQGVHRKGLTTVAVLMNILLLGAFKYAYFIADLIPGFSGGIAWGSWRLDEWMLPLGISFYTFQSISYVLDVHRRTLKEPASLLSFATYITFFPQLVAGPIVRATQFLPQLNTPLWTSPHSQDARHVRLILTGFLKKLVLGDLVGAWIVDPVFDHPSEWHSWGIALALYGYSLQVYADFSGYTDMAKGMAGLLGIQLPENFRFPYKATSPSEFWRRWHMTLSAWWKDYLYIPLGGNRSIGIVTMVAVAAGIFYAGTVWGNAGGWFVVLGGALLVASAMMMAPTFHRKMATALNVMLVMLVGGLWHGAHANFVMWGGLNGLVIAAWILLPKRSNQPWKKALGWFVTFHSVVLARIWFRAGSLIAWDETTSAPHPDNAWETAQVLWLQLRSTPPANDDLVLGSTYVAGIGLVVLGYALHFLPNHLRERSKIWAEQIPLWCTWILWCIATILAVWCSLSYPKPFIYWQF